MQYYNLAILPDWKRSAFTRDNKTCVFLSHKKEDESAAVAIGNYLTETVGVHIYLDTKDCELKEAVSTENDQRIVDSIEKGLEYSTHLLCIVSDKTRLSWWVPFEIGFAEKKRIEIASLKLKNIDGFPSYLKIKKTLYNERDFLNFASHIMPLSEYLFDSNLRTLSSTDRSSIEVFIDK